MTFTPVPISEAQAKAIQATAKFGSDAIDIVRSGFGYGAKILGTLPENLVGVLGADWLEQTRLRNIDKFGRRTKQILDERSVKDTQSIPLSLGLPLMHAAADEDRDELVDLWAKLLASAMDTSRRDAVRRSFIDTVAKMDPVDARVLNLIYSWGGPALHRDHVAQRLEISNDAAFVSLRNLIELGILSDHPDFAYITPKGRELRRALS